MEEDTEVDGKSTEVSGSRYGSRNGSPMEVGGGRYGSRWKSMGEADMNRSQYGSSWKSI